MSRPFPSRHSSPDSFVRVNGKIRAREVRVIGVDGKQLGVISLNEALAMARQLAVDLVEVAATATPPVMYCMPTPPGNSGQPAVPAFALRPRRDWSPVRSTSAAP